MASTAPTGLRRFIVRVLDSSGGTSGLGILVGANAILTCAHVVNQALGRAQREEDQPSDGDLVEVDFPLLSGTAWRSQARVRLWLAPPPRDGGQGEDIAGLVLTADPPEGAGPARLARQVRPDSIVDLFGYPRGRPNGGWVEAVIRHEVANGLLQLDSTSGAALQVQPGFSGSPLCDRRSGHVAGLLWMAPRAGSGERDSYAIPAERLQAAWPDMLAATDREIGMVTADLFATDWVQLAGEVQDYGEAPSEPLIGREWLVEEIDAFCRERERGYFVIEGNAGMGKTAFAGWLARQKQCPTHFAQLDQNAGTVAVAVRSIGAQLIASWNLENLLTPTGILPRDASSAGWLRTVIRAAARSRDREAPGMPIILVVDAVDAAASPHEDHLPLDLPRPDQLPGGVYVVATARTGGLLHAPEGCARRYLDEARQENLADLREYLAWCADKEYLADAIASAGISLEQFTDVLVERSLGVWIYVRYVLEQIGEDAQTVRDLPSLPHGLTRWYHNNLARLCDGPDGPSLYVPLLATLAVAEEPLDAPTLAGLAGIGDRWRVGQVLDQKLRPYCQVRRLPGDTRKRFEVRHPSLGEYLSGSGAAIAAEGTETDVHIESVSSLRERLAGACRDALHRICDRYLLAWGGLDRYLPALAADPGLGGMDDRYPLRWLTWHLFKAGREEDLHRLLACGPRGRNVWFEAHEHVGDVAGYLRDVGRARGSAQRLGWQLRYALIEASIASLSTSLPPTLLGELVDKDLWTASRAFAYVEQMADEEQQAQALGRIASFLPDELLGRALSVAARCRESKNRAVTLTAVIPRLRDDLLERALDIVLDLMNSTPYISLEPMVAVISRLPRELLDTLHRRQTWIWAWNRSRCVRAADALFRSDDRSDGVRQALAELAGAREIMDVHHENQRGRFVAAMLPHIPPDAFDDVLAALGELPDLDAPLTVLTALAPAERLGDLLDFAASKGAAGLEFIRQVAPRLTAREIPVALRTCQAMSGQSDRALAFAELTPLLDAGQARMLLAPRAAPELPRRTRLGEPDPPQPTPPAFPAAGQPTSTGKLQGDYSHGFAVADFLGDFYWDEEYVYLVIGALLDQLPKEVARHAVSELIIPRLFKPASTYTSTSMFRVESRRVLASVAPYLSAERRRSVLHEVFTVMSVGRSAAESEVPFLARFAPLSEHEVGAAFTVLENAHPFSWWPQSAQMMADVLAFHVRKHVLETIAARVMAFPVERECFAALAALGQLQPDTIRDDTARRALAMAANIKNPRNRARSVAELAPILLREDLSAKAFDIVGSVEPFAGVWAMDAMADVLPPSLLRTAVEKAAAPHSITDPVKDIPRILTRLAEMGDTAVIDSVLPHPSENEKVTRLAPLLSASQARHIWSMADRESLTDARAESLAALVSRLPEQERPTAVDEILAAHTPRREDMTQARILGRLARAASTERLTQAFRDFLDRGDTVKELALAEFANDLPELLIEEALRYALSDDDDISCRAVAKLAPRLSGALLNQAIIHVSQMNDEWWKAVALTALAQQLPHNREDRETTLEMALEATAFATASTLEGVMANLIPELPERLRPRAVTAAMDWVCQDLRLQGKPNAEQIDRLNEVLKVLRSHELEHLYTRLSEEVQVPQVRASAQAAVIWQAGARHVASFFSDGQPLHHNWPLDSGRAALMGLTAAAAWWMYRHGEDTDINQVIQAIFDVIRWWP